MRRSFEDMKILLRQQNIKLSHHRLKVLEYLAKHHIHPTVEQIYDDLHKEIPTLSKTTVYNSLHALANAGLVRIITIEDNETRYDLEVEPHGHFKCERCGIIFNFTIDIDKISTNELNHFEIREKSVYFKGICPTCLQQVKDNDYRRIGI